MTHVLYEKKKNMKEACLIAFQYTVPMLTSLTVLGMTYGILMQSLGVNVFWATLMSALAFGGSAQFAVIPFMITTFAPIQALVLSFLINARHIFYGIPLLHKFRGTGEVRPFLIYALTDETFSLFTTVELSDRINRKFFYFWATFFNYIYWVIGTVLGGIAGSFVTGNLEGLEFAMTALFLVLFLEQWEKKANRPMALIGFGSSLLCLFIFGQTNYMIPAMFLMMLILLGGKNKLC